MTIKYGRGFYGESMMNVDVQGCSYVIQASKMRYLSSLYQALVTYVQHVYYIQQYERQLSHEHLGVDTYAKNVSR